VNKAIIIDTMVFRKSFRNKRLTKQRKTSTAEVNKMFLMVALIVKHP